MPIASHGERIQHSASDVAHFNDDRRGQGYVVVEELEPLLLHYVFRRVNREAPLAHSPLRKNAPFSALISTGPNFTSATNCGPLPGVSVHLKTDPPMSRARMMQNGGSAVFVMFTQSSFLRGWVNS